jgi:hypothetical protein
VAECAVEFTAGARGIAPRRARRAAILLEVVLSMAIFVTMAGVILTGVRNSIMATHRLGLEARARNLAVTTLSEVQMGQLPLQDDGPNTYEDESLAGWTWQVVVSEPEYSGQVMALKRVEIVIAHTEPEYSYRLAQLLQDEQEQDQGRAAAGGDIE